ncbi:D-inositol-3-phosphate glycosyltransferase [subsurface metagenome]
MNKKLLRRNKFIRVMHVLNTYTSGSWAVELAENYNSYCRAIIVSLRKAEPDIRPHGSIIGVHNLKIRSYFGIKYIKELIKLIDEYDVDVIHTHHNFSGALIRIIAKFKGVPVVDTEHNIHSSFRFFARLINGITLPLSDVIVCVSPSVKQSFFKWELKLLKKTKIHVITNGVDFTRVNSARRNREALLKEYDFPENSYVMLNVGMLIKQKNQMFLLEIISELKQQEFDNVRLIILGEGDLRRELESKIKVLKLEDHVRMPGLVPREKVYEVLKSSNLFVLPSLWEGLPIALLECLVAGTPALVSDIQSHIDIANIIRSSSNDTSFEKTILCINSACDWVEHIKAKLNEDVPQCVSPTIVQTIFSYNRMVQDYEKLYENCLRRDVKYR